MATFWLSLVLDFLKLNYLLPNGIAFIPYTFYSQKFIEVYMNNSSADKTIQSTQSVSLFKKMRENLTRKKVILLLIIFAAIFSFFQPEIVRNLLEKIWGLIY